MKKNNSDRDVLEQFSKELKQADQMRRDIFGSEDATHPEPDSMWEMGNIYSRVFGEPIHWHKLMKLSKKNSSVSRHRLARPIYDAWMQKKKGAAGIQGEKIPQPTEKETLQEYLKRLAKETEESMRFDCPADRRHSSLYFRSLRGFLHYVVEEIKEGGGVVYKIFPPEWVVWCDEGKARNGREIALSSRSYIVRDITKEERPISFKDASQLIEDLTQKSIGVRRYTTASATLGFLWLCIAVAFRGVTVSEKVLHALNVTDLKGPRGRRRAYVVEIQTVLGVRHIPISQFTHDFLLGLPRRTGEARIFSLPIGSIHRMLGSCRKPYKAQLTIKNFLQPLHW